MHLKFVTIRRNFDRNRSADFFLPDDFPTTTKLIANFRLIIKMRIHDISNNINNIFRIASFFVEGGKMRWLDQFLTYFFDKLLFCHINAINLARVAPNFVYFVCSEQKDSNIEVFKRTANFEAGLPNAIYAY